MVGPNGQSGPSDVSRIRRVKRYNLSPARDPQLDRPVGVTLISAAYFIVGGVLLAASLFLVWRLVINPREFVQTFIYFFAWGFAVVLVPISAIFILAAIGLWRLQKRGLRLAVISAIVVLLWGLFVALSGSYQGLIFVPPATFILYYLAQRRVRALFR